MVGQPLSVSQACILVVDDVDDNRLLLGTLLQGEGHNIAYATDGQSTLDYVQATPPDLILLDVMMPGIDGIEVTRQIRKNPTLPFIPILLITAHDRPNVVQGLDAGADDFLRKPVDLNELLARVRSLLRLKRSVDERDQIARQREDFVSRLTHDLRTPLIAADRMLELLQQEVMGPASPAMQEAFQVMARSNQNLLDLVNQLLEVYRYEAGRKELVLMSVNVITLLEDVVRSLEPLAAAKGLEIQWDVSVPTDKPFSVAGDRLELQRVFINLIGNAIKFTDKGHIIINIGLENRLNPPQCEVAIQDTGIGLSSQDQEHLFDRFQTGRHPSIGSGLGLYLSQHIITAHTGQLQVESSLGKGSVFRVRLPLAS